MAFTKEQTRAIEATGKVIVSASAGSGKTTVMIQKMINLILSGVGVDEVLAVTFTKKAAAQMKEKLSRELIAAINDPATDKKKRTELKKRLSQVPTADISTIHGYCSKLIRSHFFAAGVDSNFRVIDGGDAEGRALKNAALDELLERGYEEGEEDFQHLLSCYWRKKKDDALRGILLDSYAALRDRADYLDYLEKNARGVTEKDFKGVCTELHALFVEKCRYYRELVEDELAYFSTVGEPSQKQQSLCCELIAWLEAYEGTGDYFAARGVERPALTAKSTSKKDSEEKKKHIERLAFLRGRIVKFCEEEFKEVEEYEEELSRFLSGGKTAAALAKYLIEFDKRYAEKKTERGVLDYNDLEHKALALLKEEEIAAEVRGKYRYVFVDEYQDVNPVQEQIISRLSGGNVFLVGDIKQAIYGFRGSKSIFFAQKQEELSRGGQSLFMRRNFRSADEVLDAVNAQFALAMTPRVCAVDYARDSYMDRGGRYEVNSGKVQIHFVEKEEKIAPQKRMVYSVMENSGEKAEEVNNAALLTAQIIQDELKGFLIDQKDPDGKRRVRYGDIAILIRKGSKEVAETIAALTNLGMPVTSASSINVCDFSEVKALIDILSLLDNAEQDIPLCSALLSSMGKVTTDELSRIRLAYKGVPFRAACKYYAGGQTDALSQKLRDFYGYFHKLRMEMQVLSAGETLAKILADTQMEAGLLARKNGRACLRRIRRFLEEATTFDGDSVHEFLAHLRNLDYKIAYKENGGENSVKVMTMHSSKGLEFPIVILPNLNAPFRGGRAPEVYVEEKYGLAPMAFDSERMLRHTTLLRKLFKEKEEKNSIADELNLYYVALTRAEQKLHLLFTERTPMPDVKYAKSYAELTDFSVWEKYVVYDEPFFLQRMERQSLLKPCDEGEVNALLQAMAWQYSHAGYENLPVKSSPTQLMEGGRYIPTHRFSTYGKEEDEAEEAEESVKRDLAVREGTAYHAFLEQFDFALLTEGGKPISKGVLLEKIEETLAKAEGLEQALLSKDKLVEILSNPVFYTLQDARLYKEQQFLVSLPVKQTYAKKRGMEGLLKAEGEEEMLFQGAIDLLAVGEETRIIDYKYSTRSAEELKAHYQPQLNLYKLAVAKVLKIPAEGIRCSIVNIREGFQVDMD